MAKNMPNANTVDAQLHLRLFGRDHDGRDAEALRRQPDARQRHEAGGELQELRAAAAAARHHDQHQRRPTSIRSRRSSSPGSRARPGTCSATSCTPRAPDRRTLEREERPPATGGLSCLSRSLALARASAGWRRSAWRHSAVLVRPSLSRSQRAKLRSAWAMNSSLLTKPSLSLSMRRKKAVLPLELAVGRRLPSATADEQLVLGELAVVVGVELLEAGLLARRPFGAVDEAVLVGIVAHDAAGAARRRGGGCSVVGRRGSQAGAAASRSRINGRD